MTSYLRKLVFFLEGMAGNTYLVVMRKHWRHLSADERNVLAWEFIPGPGAGIQAMVVGFSRVKRPVPRIQTTLFGTHWTQHLLVNCLPLATDTHRELHATEKEIFKQVKINL